MKMLANAELRHEMKRLSVPLWAIADKQGVCEMSVSRRLRHELPEAEKAVLLDTIRQISDERRSGR